jgi:NAD+ synthase (glutamine-hydrolysing)
VILGVSGGLDSTLALLSLVRMCDTYGLERKNIIGVTMPALATTSESKNRATQLMENLNVTAYEIPIKEEVLNQLHLINHDGQTKDITYENAQARYRTMLLLNLANKEKGIVIGTSDMSEIALGWSTFGGDQFAMYGINAGLPKTLVKRMVAYYYDIYPEVKDILGDIIAAPITPELTDKDQNTEAVLGDYQINDFILFQHLNCGATHSKIKFLLGVVFGLNSKESERYIENFNRRFKMGQYKRLSSPESVKVLSISLTNTDYRLPGDIK